ncbi:MAG: preprotein translocase subunit SecG [Chloroflexota bacterium]
MPTYLVIAELVVSIALILAVMFQVKGGGLGGIFGQPDTVYRTRRGTEKVLFRVTIALVVLFVIFAVLVVRMSS